MSSRNQDSSSGKNPAASYPHTFQLWHDDLSGSGPPLNKDGTHLLSIGTITSTTLTLMLLPIIPRMAVSEIPLGNSKRSGLMFCNFSISSVLNRLPCKVTECPPCMARVLVRQGEKPTEHRRPWLRDLELSISTM